MDYVEKKKLARFISQKTSHTYDSLMEMSEYRLCKLKSSVDMDTLTRLNDGKVYMTGFKEIDYFDCCRCYEGLNCSVLG